MKTQRCHTLDVFCFFTVFLLPLLAPAQDAPVPEAAQAARQRYDTALSEADLMLDTKTAQANTEFLDRLDRQTEQSQAAGDLDAVVALRAQRQRAVAGDMARIAKLPQPAINARAAWEKSLENARGLFDIAARAAHQDFLKDLLEAEKSETKSGRIEAAVMVRNYRHLIEKAGPPERTALKTFRRFAGRWSVRYANGVKVVIEITPAGKISQAESEGKLADAVPTQLQAVEFKGEPAILQTYPMRICLNRYTLQKNGQLLVEQWCPADRYPAPRPFDGTASRIGK